MATKEIRYAIKGTSDTEKVTKKAAADVGILDQTFNKFQYKLKHVGNQIAKSLFHMIGPLAIAHMAFGKVESIIDEYKQRIKEAVDAGAKLGHQARDTGMSVEQYQKVAEATSQMGLQVDDVAGAYRTAKKAIIEARDSTSHYHKVLVALGFSSSDLVAGKVAETEVLGALADAINSTTNETDQSTIAVKAFGAEGEKMVKVLREWVELQKKISEAKALTSPFAKILEDKASREAFEKKKDEVDIQKRKAVEAYISGEAGPMSPAVQKLVDEKRAAIEKGTEGVIVTSAVLAMDKQIQDLVEKEVGKTMSESAAEKVVKTPEAKAAAAALLSMPSKGEIKAETFKSPEGFSNVVGVGANPVLELQSNQLEEARKHTMLLQGIYDRGKRNFETKDITKDERYSPDFHGDMSD